MSVIECEADKICSLEPFSSWHFSDMAFVPGDVRSSGQTGNYLLIPSISQIAPKLT